MRLYSNHDRKAAITEPLLLFSLKPGFPAGLSLFPRPSIAVSHFTKTRVEIAVLDNSPCQIAVFGSQNGDLTRGIADFGYFNPYCGAPAHASRQGIAIGAVCLARPPDRTGGKPRRGRHRTPEPLRQADIPDLINIGGGFGRRVGLRLWRRHLDTCRRAVFRGASHDDALFHHRRLRVLHHARQRIRVRAASYARARIGGHPLRGGHPVLSDNRAGLPANPRRDGPSRSCLRPTRAAAASGPVAGVRAGSAVDERDDRLA